eukprot:CAMPEP_0181083346 /NCGR_PEP_ID=MMETSP1071-20121207/4108_1 /TAXON_ID=35127 /ORGANISM="Thalassiosira sp., Strain NH16" /LENGTH=332 /DNA_ID=CAMNT_0023164997 /DNA_START=8 /DNA_END=1005 /DNA_ORIENTATION=+
MNHLCGLPNLSLCNQGNGDNCKDDKNQNNTLPPTNCLSDDEREVLDAFRKRYETVLLASCNATDGQIIDDEDEKRKDSTNSILRQNQSLATPAYEISHDDLPGSGLRPLDDFTLYRYLLADRRGDGTFDADESHRRLLAALKFRKEWRCDAIVKNVNASSLLEAIASNGGHRPPPSSGGVRTARTILRQRKRLGRHLVALDGLLPILFGDALCANEGKREAFREGGGSNRILCGFPGSSIEHIQSQDIQGHTVAEGAGEVGRVSLSGGVDHIVLFNVPRVASAAYHMVRAFLDPVTAAKIELFAGVPYDRPVQGIDDDDVIPVEYGGRNRIY